MAEKTAKKNVKTSKTDHVLNVLGMSPASDDAAAAAAEQGTAAAENSAANQQGEHATPPILEIARTNNENLSSTIQQALEDNFDEEQTAAEQQEAEAAATAAQAEPEPEPAPAAESKAQDTPKQEPAQPAEDAPLPSKQTLSDGAILLNVMQILVEESIDRYATMFDVCRCSRCMTDIKALTLTQLPAKYVVVEGSRAPIMLGFYRSHYQSVISIELAKACSTVKEFPHHLQAGA